MPRKNQAVSLFAQIFRVDVDRQARPVAIPLIGLNTQAIPTCKKYLECVTGFDLLFRF
jgi:hypothetical protein